MVPNISACRDIVDGLVDQSVVGDRDECMGEGAKPRRSQTDFLDRAHAVTNGWQLI